MNAVVKDTIKLYAHKLNPCVDHRTKFKKETTMITKISTGTLGFPRMGPKRELKFALEKYWQSPLGSKDQYLTELLQVAQKIEDLSWDIQVNAGIERITVGDYYLYDGVLQWTEMLGIIPSRFQSLQPGYSRLFAMARGVNDAPALSMLDNS
jgi:5-methyltetrahydropteroyltriglutamate--homocysteine methyltransferase